MDPKVKLIDLVRQVGWVYESTAVTQEPDGKLIFWKIPLHEVLALRSIHHSKSLKRELGNDFERFVINTECRKLKLAGDWHHSVISALNYIDAERAVAS
ncbi:hypothetical protein FCL40_11885 [Ferrimonas sediminicola]|uniref:Uncharacterized protein n=1 Tax=Ferrimonas sediminicola TaxID=2569538 RepID=A0A4U1BCY5_9GAMM|nr:hypothetical protein [Ferrimonas sediminicola]TKB48406.1 hypothetical protein FCL40_11885 [Ferrimonas sediminicola]